MLKYRSLTEKELKELEPEFKQFLIVNELYDSEWRELVANNPHEAQSFLDLFSNIVLEKVFNKIPGMVQIGKDFIAVFDFQGVIWNFYFFQAADQQALHSCAPENFLVFIQKNMQELRLHKGTKKSTDQKAAEVHALISKGAFPLQKEQIQEFLSTINT